MRNGKRHGRGFPRRRVPLFAGTLFLLAAALVFPGCGGGGGGSSETASTASPPPAARPAADSVTAPPPAAASSCAGRDAPWQRGVFCPSEVFLGLCADPSRADAEENAVQGTRTDENNWIRSWTNETYLWYDEVEDRDPACCPTLEYFDHMKTRARTSSGRLRDDYSFSIPGSRVRSENAGINRVGYGAYFRIVSETPPRNVLVEHAEPGSPAAAAGLARGAQVLGIDGIDLVYAGSESEVAKLNAALNPSVGDAHSFTVLDRGASQRRSVTMTAREIIPQPVQNVRILAGSDGKNVGYMLFNNHIKTAEDLILNAARTFRTQGIEDLVLDLRYNRGGLVYIAQVLASAVAGSAGEGRNFARIEYSDKRRNENFPLPFLDDQVYAGLPKLNLPRLFVLTSSSTCSASEAVINGLRGIDVDVILIGAATCGKPYGFIPKKNCGVTYYSVESRLANAKGFGDYADGLAPDCSVSDSDFSHDLGDPEERLLRTALGYRSAGACPP